MESSLSYLTHVWLTFPLAGDSEQGERRGSRPESAETVRNVFFLNFLTCCPGDADVSNILLSGQTVNPFPMLWKSQAQWNYVIY